MGKNVRIDHLSNSDSKQLGGSISLTAAAIGPLAQLAVQLVGVQQYMYFYWTVSVQDVQFSTGLCTGEFLELKLRVFIFHLQLYIQPVYVMANASKIPELEDPPLALKSPAWEHCGVLVKYCNRHVSGVTV